MRGLREEAPRVGAEHRLGAEEHPPRVSVLAVDHGHLARGRRLADPVAGDEEVAGSEPLGGLHARAE